MKLFQHITDETEHYETYKVFGLNLMEKATIHYRRAALTNKPIKNIYKRYIGSIIYITKLYNQCGLYKREIRLFSIPIIGTERLNGHKFYQILGINIFARPQEFLRDFEEECKIVIGKKYDDVYLLHRHIGDAYSCLIFIHEIIKRNNSKRPAIMVFSEQFQDMVKMTCPNIPCVYIDSKKPFEKRLYTRFSKECFEFNGIRFFPLVNTWTLGTKLTQGFKKSHELSLHKFYAYSYCFDLDFEKCSIDRASVLPDAEKSMLDKCQENNFNIDKFVFLATETFSYELLKIDFWISLINKLSEKGYGVFVNSVARSKEGRKFYKRPQLDSDLGESANYQSFYLSLAEAFALANRAKKIVAIRSGFSEILAQCDPEVYILYSGSDPAKLHSRFNDLTLTKYPCSNKEKLHEFIMTDISNEDCIKKIVEDVS